MAPVADEPTPPRLSRRRLLVLGGASAGAAATAGLVASVVRDDDAANPVRSDTRTVPFHGERQAGIVTAAQDRLHFAAFDVTTDDRDDLVDLLREWTNAARQMTAGQEVGRFGATRGPRLAPPADTGEALDLAAANLTITFGFGPTLFVDARGRDRFGLADRQPQSLQPLPHFAGDDLDPATCGGDLCVQACADDPQVAVHAVRNLARIAFGRAALRWSQLGFGRTSSTSQTQSTPRNLMGFRDGTANLRAEQADLVDEFVWVADGDDNAGWLTGGTFLVARRITIHVETWDRTSLDEQEKVIGRAKANGAPLSGAGEFDPPDFDVAHDGSPVIPPTSHIRLAHPDANGGTRILRRGYNFVDGSDGLGNLDAGLFFIAFTRDPVRRFVPLQTRLAAGDALNEYIEHTGSAVFAVPRGVAARDEFVGAALFEH